jgi:integrase
MTRGNSHFASLKFKVAAEIWYEDQKPYWRKSTADSYEKYIRRASTYFSDFKLDEIRIEHLREYQKINSALAEDGMPRLVASSVNHDLNTLAQVLAQAGLWEAIGPLYKPLPLPRWTPPRVLTEAEEDRFFEIAANDPALSVAYWISSLTNNTSASGSELRNLQLRHVVLDSDPPVLYVPSETVKNEYRARVIPLNERGVIQVKRILRRAYSLGCTESDHYLFPFRVSYGNYDPTRPASPWFIYRQWNKLVDSAIEQGAINFRIRPHDLRHQIVTKLLEAGAPEQTVMSIAGHVSRQMLEHYSHQRIDAKAKALNMINPVKKKKEMNVATLSPDSMAAPRS